MTPSKIEQNLIKDCIKGKPVAQRQLYDRFAAKMFGVCLRYAKNHHLAEDMLQDGFVKVFRYLDKFKGTGSFEGWVRRIFVNTAIEHFRRNNPLHAVAEVQEKDTGEIDNTAMHSLAVNDLLQLVAELSDGYRMVFNLYIIEGYNHREIADMLGISEGTSKSQLARARNILKEKIASQYSETYDAYVRQRL